MTDFDLKSYDFNLPPELVAARPVVDRHSSKLLVYDETSGEVFHSQFEDIGSFLPKEASLIFNRSKVFPCRLKGRKQSGGEAEVFILSLLPLGELYPCLIRASGKKKEGDLFLFDDLQATLVKIQGDGTFLVRFNLSGQTLHKKIELIGKIPIPPYIRGGESDEEDKKTYQTVFAEELGSVAAPTAGLHFSESLLEKLKSQNFTLGTIVLHVGAGTFSPIKTDDIREHKMHEELFTIDEKNREIIQNSSYLVGVGTTTLRALESSFKNGRIEFPKPGELRSTSIFLHPGVKIHSVDALVTNFHLPKSSLLILISALIGREKALELYHLAIEKKYRFFSYGDGMLILRKKA